MFTGTGLFSALGFLGGRIITVCFIGVAMAIGMGLGAPSKSK
jgi:hypothetical protein